MVLSQAFYYTVPTGFFELRIGLFNASTCKDSTLGAFNIFQIGMDYITDIAISPGGKLYGIAVPPNLTDSSKILEFNLVTQQYVTIATIPHVYSSLTCDANGVLYAAYDSLISFNTNNGKFNALGNFPNGVRAAGDLTFRNGKLYMVAEGNDIYEVNIQNPNSSKLITKINVPVSNNFYGIVTFIKDCDNFITLATNNHTGLYELDFVSGDAKLLCNNLPATIYGPIYGAATANEFPPQSVLSPSTFLPPTPPPKTTPPHPCAHPAPWPYPIRACFIRVFRLTP